MVFEILSNGMAPNRPWSEEFFFKNMSILAFEVIVQTLFTLHYFVIFSLLDLILREGSAMDLASSAKISFVSKL